MLSPNEISFINYWSKERLRKKSFLKKLYFGLPLGVIVVVGTLVSLFSGWYEKADMALHQNASVIVVILVAGIAIVLFISIFAARHKYDQNELHYQELLAKKESD